MIEKIENLNKELSLTFERLSKYSNQEINFKPNSKKWSIGENMYHLWLTEITTEKYIRKKTSYPDTLINVSNIAKLRLKLLKLIFFLGLKFKAPKIVVDPIPENIDLQELKNKWLKSRDSFEILINNLDEEILFSELDSRIRNIFESPDGDIYLLTDKANAKIIKVNPI